MKPYRKQDELNLTPLEGQEGVSRNDPEIEVDGNGGRYLDIKVEVTMTVETEPADDQALRAADEGGCREEQWA